MSITQRLTELGLKLPPAPPPGGVYQPVRLDGNLVYVAGHGPVQLDGSLILGRLGLNMDLEAGYEAAKWVGLAMLSTLEAQLGSLDRIGRILKTFGMVHCEPTFKDHPKVINGFSELMKNLMGDENGVGARSAIGMNSLPGGIAVEIEAVFELAND